MSKASSDLHRQQPPSTPTRILWLSIIILQPFSISPLSQITRSKDWCSSLIWMYQLCKAFSLRWNVSTSPLSTISAILSTRFQQYHTKLVTDTSDNEGWIFRIPALSSPWLGFLKQTLLNPLSEAISSSFMIKNLERKYFSLSKEMYFTRE